MKNLNVGDWCLGPVNLWERAKHKYGAWKRKDRREKYLDGWHTVHLVIRDGDLGIIECPKCNLFQNLCYYKGTGNFTCFECDLVFHVYLEDGLVYVRDHREGNVLTPADIVEDDSGTYHMGLTPGAPWWWRKHEACRDYNPEDGMDGHGHEPYEILGPITSQPFSKKGEKR